MDRIGFDNEQYLKMQSEHIKERIAKFGGKLYLEFGGKLFDDYHASRVLPGFQPDSKIRMLGELKADVEIVIAIHAGDIEKTRYVEIWESLMIWMFFVSLMPLGVWSLCWICSVDSLYRTGECHCLPKEVGVSRY